MSTTRINMNNGGIFWVHADDAMTLHWWMHWFWVTAQFLVILGNPMPSSTGEPRGQVQQDRLSSESTSKITSIEAERSEPRQSFRVAKAIGLHPSTNTAVMLDRQSSTISAPVEMVASVVETSTNPVEEYHGNTSNAVSLDSTKSFTSQRVADTVDRIRNSAVKKDSKITWILTTNKTGGRSKYEQEEKIDENGNRNDTTLDQVEDLTVLPLQEEVSRIRLVLNKTKSSSLLSSSSSSSLSSSAGNSGIKTFNRSDDVEINDDDDFVEPQFATAASILEVGVSEPTRLSRARSAFPKDFQRDQVQEDHLSDYNESNSENSKRENTSRSTVDIAAITGSCLATVVLLSTMGSLGFIMYRRRYLNPPQTLNSDKCSNPDSSGYIDDSTIRDNSEEMYSLDNDSFLNSLEAMTIQNYWTDSVKHTKL
ncbi:uncharacterized protein LOC100578709 isoform X1 [Apis mellifera]|uniref:Uncharacterized protein LOC100578709 isoform X1 n=2 Tax=Apis mellifera TaxID=7460 RepID=A0A7M7GAN6_APIME|nr:uncharacterized protein LOC100578709 isoform X1 [Apis mellifera]|eukprot:XP_003251558.1 uncharacterized protein LOC100578709 isoform X1 [Apis mellifera]